MVVAGACEDQPVPCLTAALADRAWYCETRKSNTTFKSTFEASVMLVQRELLLLAISERKD